jgi:serine/threonine protein kinase
MTSAGDVVAGRYILRRFLGRGSFGEVWEAWDDNRSFAVALKLMFPNPHGPPTWDEARLLTGLAAGRILTVHDAAVIPGIDIRYIATELATHGTLAMHISPLGLSWPATAKYFQEASYGLSRIHDAGLVHRDIKPENLFVDAAEEALVGDLGLAAALDVAGRAFCGGTPETMAPEVAAHFVAGGRADAYTLAAETYSLGASLRAALVGEYAHKGATDHDTMIDVVATVPVSTGEAAPHLPLQLHRLVDACMNRDPDLRPGMSEVTAELGRIRTTNVSTVRVAPHPGHERCYVTSKNGRADISVCVLPAGRSVEIDVFHTQSQRRIRAECRTVARGALGGRLRGLFGRLGR